jgi:LAS superfamily LD-carboxypeptidase LdcB
VRVIEPSQLKRTSIKKKRSKKLPLFVLLLVAGLGVGGWFYIQPKPITSQPAQQNNAEAVPTALPNQETKLRTTLKTFTNQEFVNFYSTFAYPNTAEITIAPFITGNADADARIQNLAEERGYKLRSAPVSPPVAFIDGLYVQQKAAQPYLDMIAAAKAEGLPITITAAFRSVEEQRQLFLERLGAPVASIAAGTADDAVLETLKTTAPPGYSRHHNGFTVDIACGSVGLYGFLDTPCFSWLAKDNFKNAKEFGWIPSYPDGVNSVGPEPEPWEYVWVGRDSLLE